jgi:hypothetical protein
MDRPLTVSVWRDGYWYVSERLEVDVASQSETDKAADVYILTMNPYPANKITTAA